MQRAVVVSDVRALVAGSRTVRVHGLDAKETTLASVLFELEGLVSAGMRSARAAVEHRRGAHAATFVEEAGAIIGQASQLAHVVRRAKSTFAAWPDRPPFDPFGLVLAGAASLEIPISPGTGTVDSSPTRVPARSQR